MTSETEIFKIIFLLSSLMTSFLENLKSYNQQLTSIELSRQFNLRYTTYFYQKSS